MYSQTDYYKSNIQKPIAKSFLRLIFFYQINTGIKNKAKTIQIEAY